MMINHELHWLSIKGKTFTNNTNQQITFGTLSDCTQAKHILNDLNSAIESKKIAMEVGKICAWHVEFKKEQWVWHWDDLANSMFGLQADDVGNIDKWVAAIHPADKDKVTTALQVSLETGEVFSENFRAILPTSEVKSFFGKAKVTKNVFGKVQRIDGMWADETSSHNAQKELKKLNLELEEHVSKRTKELLEAKERAEKASLIKTQFLSMMSHELRTPMNAVIGSLDLLQSTQQNYECQDLIDTAKVSAENLVFILNDILDINKIEAGMLDIEDLTFSISEVIDNVIQVFIPVAAKKNIQLEVIEDPDVPVFVKADEIRVRQILFNLIGNAIKFTSSEQGREGFVLLKVDEIEKNQFVSNISFKVIDNGIGIEKSKQTTLFKPFTQAELSTTRKYGGTGLGLTICAKLSEMMGGQISIDSELGAGSTFDVDIPFWKSQETRAMNIIELESVTIQVIHFNEKPKPKLVQAMEHLENEGATTQIQTGVDNIRESLDILLIQTDSLAEDSVTINQLLAHQTCNKKVILCVTFNDFERAKKQYKKYEVVNFHSLTRKLLINTVLKVKQRSLEIDLDELELADDLIANFYEDLLDLEIPDQPPTPKLSHNNLKQGILLVEDNELNQKLIAKQLENIGFSCDLADDGIEGKTKWQDGDYKVILTDCHMPNMDGYEMSQAIRQIEAKSQVSKIPIIAVTGAAMSGESQLCYDAGMSDFISKPIQQNDLKKVLDKWYANE